MAASQGSEFMGATLDIKYAYNNNRRDREPRGRRVNSGDSRNEHGYDDREHPHLDRRRRGGGRQRGYEKGYTSRSPQRYSRNDSRYESRHSRHSSRHHHNARHSISPPPRAYPPPNRNVQPPYDNSQPIAINPALLATLTQVLQNSGQLAPGGDVHNIPYNPSTQLPPAQTARPPYPPHYTNDPRGRVAEPLPAQVQYYPQNQPYPPNTAHNPQPHYSVPPSTQDPRYAMPNSQDSSQSFQDSQAALQQIASYLQQQQARQGGA
eukprot:TRINITY_DN11449_c0_g1_i1.p1 TRINITY_DN11449_c0_g1~~TRINITY_DN11449_c0_g1_i1.p1  ORF type:complete len:264 (-),score=14.15 TRINITY_DN11449_c0_g1_i1:145-936(-)